MSDKTADKTAEKELISKKLTRHEIICRQLYHKILAEEDRKFFRYIREIVLSGDIDKK